jgi:hypothetical protein
MLVHLRLGEAEPFQNGTRHGRQLRQSNCQQSSYFKGEYWEYNFRKGTST